MIDRHGARAVMTLGTVIVSTGLFALSRDRNEVAYLAVVNGRKRPEVTSYVAMGVAMVSVGLQHEVA